MAEVTQVVSPYEGHVFHNRLTHSLKVAQVARRLAEKLLNDPKQNRIAEEQGGIDPDVVEAASLAHDIGHPPFGHIAEDELNVLMAASGDVDGFEGNAQSFRIVTKLAVRSTETSGLDLTRATLNALLKYPWLKGEGPKKDKWGAYRTESKEFRWARELASPSNLQRGLEADLMDWADDVTYAVHDAADFFCAGIVPLDRLASRRDDSERRRFFEEVFQRLGDGLSDDRQDLKIQDLENVFTQLFNLMPFNRNYLGTQDDRARLRYTTATLIHRYIHAVELCTPTPSHSNKLAIDPTRFKEVFMLKQLTWHYVILNPALATLQYGQRKIIRDLFNMLQEAAGNKDQKRRLIFPFAYREQLEEAGNDQVKTAQIVRDFIASMTERQAQGLYMRLTGIRHESALG